MADTEGANHGLDQVAAAGPQFGQHAAQRRVERAGNVAVFLDAENVNACDITQALLVGIDHPFRQAQHRGNGCVGCGK